MDPQLRTLLKLGARAERLGKRQAAEDVYRRAVAQSPDAAEAWAGLARVASTPEEQAACWQRARQLDPAVEAAGLNDADPAPVAADDPPAWGPPSPDDALSAAAAESSRWLDEATGAAVAAKEAAPAPPAPALVAELPAEEPDEEPAEDLAEEPDEEPAGEVVACAYHPTRETTLRCNRCSKPICMHCAIKTPVGYRCKECIREQQQTFYSVEWYDYLLAAAVTLPLAALASYIIYSIGWLTLFVAPFAGAVIAEAVQLVTRRRRGRWLPLLVCLCLVLGSLPGIGVWALGGWLSGLGGVALGDLVWQVVYLVLAVSSAYYRTR